GPAPAFLLPARRGTAANASACPRRPSRQIRQEPLSATNLGCECLYIDIAAANDDSNALAPQRPPQRTHQRRECSRPAGLYGELELAKQECHRTTNEVIVDADELIDIHPAQAKGIRHRHGRAEAVGDGRYPIDLLRCVGAEAPVHRVGSLRLHSVYAAAGLQELACRSDSGRQAAAAYPHQERIQRGRLAGELGTERCSPECRVLAFKRVDQSAVLAAHDLARELETSRSVG